MAEKEFDPWQFGSGLPESYHGTIQQAYFEFNEEGDRVLLKLDIQTDDPDVGESGAVTEQYPCGGEDWEPINKGARIRNVKGDNKTFNRNSGIALLCQSAILHGIALQERGDGTPFDAALWKGIEADFKRYEFTMHSRRDNTDITYSRMLFDNGEPDEDNPIGTGPSSNGANAKAAKKAGAKKATAPKQDAKAKDSTDADAGAGADAETGEVAADAPAPAGGDPYGLGPVLTAKLKAVARKHDDHALFMEEAFATISDVAGNEAAEAVVIDGSAGGLWASVQNA